MDIETVFLSVFSIKKKPDIVQLIKASIQVGALKHPTKFKKHRDEILMMLLNPQKHSVGDEETDSASDIEEEIDSAEFSGDDLHQTNKRSQEVDQETRHILGRQGNYNISNTESTLLKVKLSLKKTRDIDDKHVGSDKEKKTEAGKCRSNNTESKNMSCVTKKSPGRFRKLNEDINSTVVEKQDCSPHIKRLEEGEQLRKQSNCSVITRPMQKVTQSSTVTRPMEKAIQCSTVARPMQNTTQSIRDMKRSRMKFESSKRKFEERVAEQNKAKRRIIMVDFHDMPKPAKDSCAPKRCWDRRKRF